MIKKCNLILGILFILLFSSKSYAMPKDIGSHWAKEDIITLESLGIMNKYSDGNFRPKNFINRGEYVMAVEKLLGYKDPGTGFSDYITREECIEVLGRALGCENLRPESIYHFGDYEEISNNSILYVNLLFEKGYVSGDEYGRFNPKARITRGEVARILNLVNRNTLGNKKSSSGSHHIQMGSFLSLESAKMERNILLQNGYENAVVVKFKDLSLYSVLIDYNLDEEYSNHLHMKLLEQGIEANIIMRNLLSDEILIGNKKISNNPVELVERTTSNYSVQTGVFSKKEIANIYKNNLIKCGFKDTFIVEDTGTFYVLANTNLNKESADELCVKLITKGFEAFSTNRMFQKSNIKVTVNPNENKLPNQTYDYNKNHNQKVIIWGEQPVVHDLKYHVQVGVYSKYEGAYEMYEMLREKNFTAPMVLKENGKYIVISKAYLDKVSSNKHLSLLKANTIDGIIKSGKKINQENIILN